MTARGSYPSYRDSGLPWLGEIPAHWEPKRIKFVARFVYGDSLAAEDREDGDVPVFGSNGIVGTHSKANTDAPCLVIGRKGSYGKVNYSERPCFAIDTTYLIDRRSTKEDVRFLFYAFSPLDLDESSQDTGVPGLSREFAHNRWLPLPPLPEQRTIAAYLDNQTARIDALIGKNQRLLELLDEQRTALISQAVTKGLNPDVAMKDSGAAGPGRIPAHWDVKRMKFVARINPSKTEISHLPRDLQVSFLRMELVGQGALTTDTTKALEDVGQGFTYFRNGDVVVAKITPSFENGKGSLASGLANEIAFGTTELHVIRPTSRIDARFLYYVTISHAFRHVGEGYMQGTAGQKRVPDSFVIDYPVALPPTPEQHVIGAYLDRATARIDALVTKVETAIERLREYRGALISSAVTGKIKV